MKKPYIKILIIFLAIIAIAYSGGAQIRTPKGTAVTGITRPEFSSAQISAINAEAARLYPNAQRLANASQTYNCHSYAWYLSEAATNATKYWVNTPEDDKYWNDGSYIQICNQSESSKISYASDDHSAIRSSVAGKFDSKWGSYPLLRHDPGYTPYNSSSLKYYVPTKINYSTTNICSPVTFSVKTFTGGTYRWTKSANINLNTTTGGSVTASPNGSGAGWIEVVITSTCSAVPVTTRLNVTVGPTKPVLRITGVAPYGAAEVTCTFVPGASSYKWYVNNVLKTTTYTSNAFLPLTCGSNSIYVIAATSCGEAKSDQTPETIAYYNCVRRASEYKVSPNPASDKFAIQLESSQGISVTVSTPDFNSKTFDVLLFDEKGNLVLTSNNKGKKSILIDTKSINNGNYYLHIKEGDQLIKKQVIISH